jgi:hypothetical protein
MREIHAECVKIFRKSEDALGTFAEFRSFSQKNLLASPVLKNFLINVLTVLVI